MTSRRIDLPAVYSWLKSQPGGVQFAELAERFNLPPKCPDSFFLQMERAGFLVSQEEVKRPDSRKIMRRAIIYAAFERN